MNYCSHFFVLGSVLLCQISCLFLSSRHPLAKASLFSPFHVWKLHEEVKLHTGQTANHDEQSMSRWWRVRVVVYVWWTQRFSSFPISLILFSFNSGRDGAWSVNRFLLYLCAAYTEEESKLERDKEKNRRDNCNGCEVCTVITSNVYHSRLTYKHKICYCP